MCVDKPADAPDQPTVYVHQPADTSDPPQQPADPTGQQMVNADQPTDRSDWPMVFDIRFDEAGNVIEILPEVRQINQQECMILSDPQIDSNVRSRKHVRQPETWKKNVRKRRRQSGLDYINTRGILISEKIFSSSTCNCPRQCRSKVPDDERVIIFSNFKSMGDRNMQVAFIAGHVSSVKKKCNSSPLTESDRHKIKKNCYKYYLTLSDNRRVEVCKKFFVDTLPVGRKTLERVAKTAVGGMAKPDQRGKKPSNKKSGDVRDYIRKHIISFPAVESHYCRADSAKKYLDANLYCDKCREDDIQPQNEKFSRTLFNTEFNIGFHHPKKDECNYCSTFKNSSAGEKVDKQDEYNAHHARNERVRLLKKEHKELAMAEKNRVRAVTFDLQQVLQSPSLSVGALFYKRKLSVYNQTVYNLADHNVDCFVWHEGTGGRGSSEMASCLCKFMKNLPNTIEHLILYSDTCGGQNRNINFASMCLHAVTILPIKTIDHIYMESGHSQMECDSVHSTIEKAKRTVPIYSPMDYYTVIGGARQSNRMWSIRCHRPISWISITLRRITLLIGQRQLPLKLQRG